MPSIFFKELEASIKELKRHYLNDGNFPPVPTPLQQELARAFVVLAHAELEEYVEKAFQNLSNAALNGVANGLLSRVAFSMMVFSGLPAQTGGTFLRIPSPKKTPRLLATRFGDAHARYSLLISKNHGIREKYLASLGVPIGLNAKEVDPVWISELESFCDKRGTYAHHSRMNADTKLQTIDPQDIWAQCERIIWDVKKASTFAVGSFLGLDDWVEQERLLIGSQLLNQSAWRMRLLYILSMWSQFWKSRGWKKSEEGGD